MAETFLRSLVFVLGCAGCGPAAFGQAAPITPPQEMIAVQAFGETAPACLAWSDGCVICKRGDDGKPNCSTPGIACLPGGILCQVERGK